MPNGACCCDNCLVSSDDFGDATITGWTQQTGSWSESGGQLTEGTGGGIITHDTGAAGDQHIVRSEIVLSSVGDRARVFGNYSGVLDYLYAEIQIDSTTSATLKIGAQATGDFDTVSIAITGGLPYRVPLGLCIGTASTVAFVPGSILTYQDATTPGGTQGGLEVVAGNPAFDSFSIYEDDCFPCTAAGACGCCKNGVADRFMKLTMSGFTGGGAGACQCTDLDATLICRLPTAGAACGGIPCRWTFGLPASDEHFAATPVASTAPFVACGGVTPNEPCTTSGFGTLIKWDVLVYHYVGVYYLSVAVIEGDTSYAPQSTFMIFETTFTVKPECNTWVDVDLPFTRRSPENATGCCTPGTVTVTSI